MPTRPLLRRVLAKAPALGVWVLAWWAMRELDGVADLGNLALILVLASAMSGLWLRAWESALICAGATLAFNWQFVPPRATFKTDLQQHMWLLLTMMAVGSLVAWLLERQRLLAESAKARFSHARILQTFSEQLGLAPAETWTAHLQGTLQALSGATVAIATQEGGATDAVDAPATETLQLRNGQVSEDECLQLRQCASSAMPSWQDYSFAQGHKALSLPLRGQLRCYGAVLLRAPDPASLSGEVRATAQALCEQLALHIERTQAQALAQRASQEAQTQRFRNTLLAAISHDYRTPLATILGAASSLVDQSDRLSREQARALATTIMTEVAQLGTLTDNTLQLVRLDSANVHLNLDWQAMEELAGSALSSARVRYPHAGLHLRIQAGLPLLWCDAQLVMQLLHNLLDNAIKYGGDKPSVEVSARQVKQTLLLTVADRGPGIAGADRERVILTFERGTTERNGSDKTAVRGAGLGLALCRAIVQAHGGRMAIQARPRGGTRVECWFTLQTQPSPAKENLA